MNLSKQASPLIGSLALAVLLSACAYGGDHRGFATAGVDYDGYYDDYYGPINDGYWGADGVFLYSTGEPGVYHRDDARHIQRDVGPGRHNIHGHHADHTRPNDSHNR